MSGTDAERAYAALKRKAQAMRGARFSLPAIEAALLAENESGQSIRLLRGDVTRVASLAVEAPPHPHGLAMSRADALTAKAGAVSWLARPLLERDTLAQLVGPPRSLKSFLALHVACSLATGREWCGRHLAQAPALVMCGEGHAGVARRLKAWEIAHGIPLKDCPLYVTHHAVPIDDKAVALAVTEAIERITTECGMPPALVVIDTLARHHNGDENDAGAMGRLLQTIDTYIRRPYGTTALLVHHTGHTDSGRARGSSALRAAVDTEWVAERSDRIVTFRCTKSKDADEGEPIAFELRVVELPWVDGDGKPVTSAVLHPTTAPEPVREPQGANQSKALATLRQLTADGRARLERQGFDPEGARVTVDEWRDACGLDRRRWPEVQRRLIDARLIEVQHPYVSEVRPK